MTERVGSVKNVLRQYERLKNEAGGALLMMQKGAFMCMYGEDADIAIRVCNLALSQIPTISGNISKCGFPVGAQGKYGEILKAAGYKIAIAVEDNEIDPHLGIKSRVLTLYDRALDDAMVEVGNTCKCKACLYLRNIDINALTPLEAINQLEKLKKTALIAGDIS